MPRNGERLAGLFAEDVRRHLEGMPVKARRETVTYRAGRDDTSRGRCTAR